MIYIAGPMRGLPEFNFPAFDAAAERLAVQGYSSWSPAENDRENGFDAAGMKGTDDELAEADFDLRQAMADNCRAICEARIIYLLDGWENSTGATLEKQLGEMLGLEIWYETEPEPHEPQPAHETLAVNNRSHVLLTAEQYVNKDRNTTYDEPNVDFQRIARLWSEYLDLRGFRFDDNNYLTMGDVARLMILMKLSRLIGNPEHEDSWIDIAGYAACGFDVEEL